MTTISDEFMKQVITTAKTYTAVILTAGPNIDRAGVKQITWEHARRNFALRADGLLSIVCPVMDASEVKGIGIFNAGEAETKKIMDEDPGVAAGVFVYEAYPCRSFPGDSLPK